MKNQNKLATSFIVAIVLSVLAACSTDAPVSRVCPLGEQAGVGWQAGEHLAGGACEPIPSCAPAEKCSLDSAKGPCKLCVNTLCSADVDCKSNVCLYGRCAADKCGGACSTGTVCNAQTAKCESRTVVTCVPNSTQVIACSAPNASSATQTNVCNAAGTAWTPGTCVISSCNTGYNLQGNTCVVNATCTPNSTQVIACSAPNASSATQTNVCNAAGTAWTPGTCVISSCNTGYSLIAGTCQPNVPATCPGPCDNGWCDGSGATPVCRLYQGLVVTNVSGNSLLVEHGYTNPLPSTPARTTVAPNGTIGGTTFTGVWLNPVDPIWRAATLADCSNYSAVGRKGLPAPARLTGTPSCAWDWDGGANR